MFLKRIVGVTERPRALNPSKAIAMTICPIIVHFKVARNSFHFPQTSFKNSFSKYSLVYRISLKFTTVINETS